MASANRAHLEHLQRLAALDRAAAAKEAMFKEALNLPAPVLAPWLAAQASYRRAHGEVAVSYSRLQCA